jgi:hypothetical protein
MAPSCRLPQGCGTRDKAFRHVICAEGRAIHAQGSIDVGSGPQKGKNKFPELDRESGWEGRCGDCIAQETSNNKTTPRGKMIDNVHEVVHEQKLDDRRMAIVGGNK